MQTKIKNKISVGIACFRNNNGVYEVLLVKKWCTYAYSTFVQGNWSPMIGKNAANNKNNLIRLFSEMTNDEKSDILSLNFRQMWYRIWGHDVKVGSYNSARIKFENTFLIDNGILLKELIFKSRHIGYKDKLWEIPKGRKISQNEPDVNCAIREFFEETHIPKACYSIIPNFIKKDIFIDEGVRYTNKYYIAYLIKTPKFKYRKDQNNEIIDARWVRLDEIRFIDVNKHLSRVVKPMFNYIKKYNL